MIGKCIPILPIILYMFISQSYIICFLSKCGYYYTFHYLMGRYEKCDPNATNWWGVDDNDIAYNDAVPLALESVSAEDSSSKVDAAPQMAADEMVGEDSYETNNQVDGVDEADVAKSDGGKFSFFFGTFCFLLVGLMLTILQSQLMYMQHMGNCYKFGMPQLGV